MEVLLMRLDQVLSGTREGREKVTVINIIRLGEGCSLWDGMLIRPEGEGGGGEGIGGERWTVPDSQ